MRLPRVLLAVFSVVAAACSTGASGSIQLVTGGESDTFTLAPVPTKLEVQSVDTSGHTTLLATQPLPASTIDLGSLSESTIAALEVTGFDAKHDRVVFGASLPLLFGGLDGLTVPLFVQRVGAFARLPGPLGSARQAPLLGDVQGEYLLVAGGTPSSLSTGTELYDFAGFAPLPSPPTLPLAPQSAAFVGTVGWLFAADGTAQYFDLGSSQAGSIPPLTGGSFADVAGGATVVGDGGVQYVVGATRTAGAPTAAVLRIDPADTSNSNYPYGGPTWLTLSAPRLGAAATWITGRGLVVTGGSATAHGVEIVGVGATSGAALAFPPDDSVSGGCTALSNATVLLAGGFSPTTGDPGVRTVDLSCAAQCAPGPWTAALPVALFDAQAFTMSTSEAFVVGSVAFTGLTRAFTVTSTTATEIPTKVPHTNARAIWSPVGSIALVGGSEEIETFVF